MKMNKQKLALALFLISAVVLAAFLPCFKNGFVNWDDDKYVTDNPSIRSVSLANLNTICTSTFVGHYLPVTMLSFLCDYHWFKQGPLGYHAVNIILHMANVLLVFWLMFILTKGNIPASLITAVLFGIHPLQVESVAWISERKNVLYTLFFLGAMISYIYYFRTDTRIRYYWFSVFLFALSLLSKSIAVILPVVLCLIDYLFRRKPGKALWIEKIPYMALSLVFGIIQIVALSLVYGATQMKEGRYFAIFHQKQAHGIFNTLGAVLQGIVFYLGKIFLPLKLSCLYPHYNFEHNPAYVYASVTVIILFIGIMISGKYTRKVVFGSSFFLITLAPTFFQCIPVSAILVADRYSYIPSIGIFYLVAVAVSWFYAHAIHQARLKAVIVAAAIFTTGALVFLTWKRCEVWNNSIVLWGDVLHKHSLPVAYFNRGIAYANSDNGERAVIDIERALALFYDVSRKDRDYTKTYNELRESKRGYPAVYDFLAIKFAEAGITEPAVLLLRKAVQLEPSNVKYYADLCAAYGDSGKFVESIATGEEAIKLDRNSAISHYNLSVAFYSHGQYGQALEHLKTAAKLGFKPDPGFVAKVNEARQK